MASRRRVNRKRTAPKRRLRFRNYRRQTRRRMKMPNARFTMRLPRSNCPRALIGLEYGYYNYGSVAGAGTVWTGFFSAANPVRLQAGTVLQNPQGWDQWAVMYKFCRVVGIKLTWRFNPIAGANTAITTRSYWNNDSTYTTNIQTETQNKYTKLRDVRGDLKGIIHKWYIKPWTAMGISKLEYMTDVNTRQSTATQGTVDPVLMAKGWMVVRNLGGIAYSYHESIRAKIYYEFTFPTTLADA